MTKRKEELKIPDYIQIPCQLIRDKSLSPIDRLTYGAIYYYSKMRGERCFATNTTISKLLLSTPKTICRSLQKLEDRRYILRSFSDPETKKNRTEIIPLIAMGRLPINKSPKVPPNGGIEGQMDVPPNGGTVPPNGGTGTPKQRYGVPPNGRVIENIEENKIENKEPLQSPPSGNDLPGRFTDRLKSYQKGIPLEQITETMVSEAIGLFLPVLPDFFVTHKPFAMKPTRDMVKKILLVYTLDELKEIIEKYNMRKTDKFRPGNKAKTIYSFCLELDRIKTYLGQSAGGLWAQRPISTPTQRADSDELIKQRLEIMREKQRKNKEEWEKNHPINN